MSNVMAESYDAGETVSAVARRYALSPQQLFAWRRSAGAIGECAVTGAIVCSSGGRGTGARSGGEAREIDTQAEGRARSRRDRAGD
jgi:transposase-like protein